jgi:hypothetical protein
MENKAGFTGVRKAYIHAINANGSYDIFYSDDNSNNVIKGVSTVASGSFGAGIFTQFHEGAQVLVGQGYMFEPVIIGAIASLGSIEQGSVLESNDIDNPDVGIGEVVIQSSSGAHIDLRNSGDVKISNLKNDGVFLSDAHRSLSSSAYQQYNFNDSGYTISGRVKRFHPSYLPGSNPIFVDLLSDPEADAFTIDIARDQSQKATPMNRVRGVSNVVRNPSFAEKREVILEFADSFFVRDSNTEMALASDFPQAIQQMNRSIARRRGYGENEQTFDNLRHSSRTNVLKLDNNVIIERIQGTLVDIFGNVLDLNYNKIKMPKISETGKSGIQNAHNILNRSVAYHFQVNTRNIIHNPSGSNKFTFDIDKEGQFKLNVPRSSSSGTIPTISTFTTSNSDISNRLDINNIQLSASQISSPTGGHAGTAFHDMTKTADRLLRHNVKSVNLIRQHSNTTSMKSIDAPNIEYVVSNSISSSSSPSYTTTISVQPDAPAISNKIDKNVSGGRSGQMNYEGSLEISVGADDGDEKSIMLDTDGSFIGWFGADSEGRSIVLNADGGVAINIGDYMLDIHDNSYFNPGSLDIRVNLVDEKKNKPLQPGQLGNNKITSDHIISISPKGIVISSGNGTPMVLRSSGDFMIEAAGTLDIKAKNIQLDGGSLRKVSSKKGDI